MMRLLVIVMRVSLEVGWMRRSSFTPSPCPGQPCRGLPPPSRPGRGCRGSSTKRTACQSRCFPKCPSARAPLRVSTLDRGSRRQAREPRCSRGSTSPRPSPRSFPPRNTDRRWRRCRLCSFHSNCTDRAGTPRTCLLLLIRLFGFSGDFNSMRQRLAMNQRYSA